MAKHIPNIELRQSAVVICLRILFIQICFGVLHAMLFALTFWLAASGQLFFIQTAIIVMAVFLHILNTTLLLGIILTWVNTTYTITQTDIVAQEGIFTLKHSVYKGSHVEEVDVRESFLGRLFNYGTIKFFNPILKQDVFLINIPNPLKYAEILKRFDSNERILFIPKRPEGAKN